MFNESISPADIAAVTGNDRDGFGGGNGWWVLIILFALFGGWGNGFGNRGDGSIGAEVQRGFDNQEVMNKLDGLTNGLSTLGYDQLLQMNGITNAIQQKTISDMQQMFAMQTQMNNGFNMNAQAVNQLGCTFMGALNQLENDVNNQFCQLKMERKDEKIADQAMMIQNLTFNQSQQAQSQYLLNQLRPNPVPSFMVPSPYFYPPTTGTTTD